MTRTSGTVFAMAPGGAAWLRAGLVAASVALGIGTGFAALPPNCTGKNPVTCTFAYNGTDGTDGSVQTFTVPEKVRVLTIDAWGAQGGGELGGLGGHERAMIGVTPGETLYIHVGGQPGGSTGGYNGGGDAHLGLAGGGGASDVRRAPGGLNDRVVVAGGGGGEGEKSPFAIGLPTTPVEGGAGGAMPGTRSPACTESIFAVCGGGGSTTGGVAGFCVNSTGKPSAGAEGVGGSGNTCGAGGGGGYLGGGGGGLDGIIENGETLFFGPGGGGSGHVLDGVRQLQEQGVRSGHGLVTITYGTKPVVPVGNVVCPWISGTAKFAKPLKNTPSTKPVKLTLKLTGSCDGSGVVGGKAPITDVTVNATLQLEAGATCSLAPYAASKPQKLQVKWQGRNARNKPIMVATTKTTIAEPFQYSVNASEFQLRSPVLTDPKKPFVNDNVLMVIGVLVPPAVQQAMCESREGLKQVDVVGGIAAFDFVP